MKQTHTFVRLEVTTQTFKEIFDKLNAANYQHAILKQDGEILIDMDGIALQPENKTEQQLQELIKSITGH
jgi:hypothetical protein